MAASRVKIPKIMSNEQPTSAKMISTSEAEAPIPKGSGNTVLSISKLVIFCHPCKNMNIPIISLKINKPMLVKVP
jgi:hypothetical protein